MLFTLRKKPRSADDIFIDHEPNEKVEHFKFLGVIIDSKLSWVDHVQFIYIKKENFQRTWNFMQG